MVEGIVYLYESPSGKYYIGQTFEELKRRKAFLTKSKYAGIKIDRARLKYGTINFKYTVLFRQMFNNIDEGYKILDSLEQYYIKKYDSYIHGYNMTLGGSKDFRGHKATEEFKNKCRIRMTLNNPFKGSVHSAETKRVISEKNTKFSVIMINKETDKEEMEFRNATEACIYLGIDTKCRNDIYKVCRGYINPTTGRRSITAHGHKWKYKEGSTTSKS